MPRKQFMPRKQKMPSLKAQLDPLLARIEKHKAVIVAERDKLRDTVEEVNAIVGSLDEGIDALDNAQREFEYALTHMSEYL